jgi:hypothetical protein
LKKWLPDAWVFSGQNCEMPIEVSAARQDFNA